MEEITAGLHATRPVELGFGDPPLEACSYLIQRPGGNLIIYGAGPIISEIGEVKELGGADRQYLNHAHEASSEAAEVKLELGARLHVHEGDRAEVESMVAVDESFVRPHPVGDDFDVIPIPGHTPGSTAFVWRGPQATVLFTGDSVFVRHGEWGAAFLDSISDRPSYVASLELLADIKFDLLAAGVAPVGQPFVVSTTPGESRQQMLNIADRLRSGLDR